MLTGGGTGGHLYPALNLARALREGDPEVRLLFVGAERGLEARVLPETDLEYRLLPVHPIHRSRPWRNWRLAAALPGLLLGTARAMAGFDPHVTVGTGGYASGPAVAWAAATGRGVVLQEQNADPGLVTRWMVRWADQVHLGFPEAAERLEPGPRTAVRTHGNPVDPAIAGRPAAAAEEFPWPEGRILLAVGGSQGARGLNRRLLDDLSRARAWPADDVALVWISGPEEETRVRRGVEETPWSEHVRVVPYLPDLGRQLHRVSVAVSRAGAMIVSELAAAGVPAVLVPFPAAAGGHQAANARVLEEAGAAVVREEADLGPGELWGTATRLLEDEGRRSRMAEAARRRGAPQAARLIAEDVLSLAADRASGSGRGGATGDG